MSDLVVSWIRTAVPVGVGAVLAWLASVAGVVVSPDASAGLTAGVTAVLAAVYYALVRLAERKWPWTGVLLGAPKAPTYAAPPAK